MTRAEKYPELSKVYDTLCAERDALLKKLAPLEAKAAELRVVADKAEAQWRAVREKIVAIEHPRMRDVTRQIGVLARQMDARSLKAEGGTLGVTAGA